MTNLMLSRSMGQSITLRTPEGREITFTIVDIRGDKVRIATMADKDVTIDRSEVAARKKQEQTA